MAGENFVGGLNSLYNRIDEGIQNNPLNYDKLVGTQNALTQSNIQTEMARRGLQADTDVRNALQGVNNLQDVRSALPNIIKASPAMGLKFMEQDESAQNTRLLRQAQLQKYLGSIDPIKGQKAALEFSTKAMPYILSNPKAYPSFRANAIQSGLPAELFPEFQSEGEVLTWAGDTQKHLAGYAAQIAAETPIIRDVYDSEGNVIPTAFERGKPNPQGTPLAAPGVRTPPKPSKPLYDEKTGRQRLTHLAELENRLNSTGAFGDTLALLFPDKPELAALAGKKADPASKAKVMDAINNERRLIELHLENPSGGGISARGGSFQPPNGQVKLRNRITGEERTWNSSTGQYE